jgi:peptide/nickel transport system permease protein
LTRYIIRRLLLLIPVLIGISIVTFAMLRLIPGDPWEVMLGEHATEQAIAELRERMGFDEPIPVQYLRYVESVLRLDLGRSVKTNRPVLQEIGQRLPATVELTLGAMVVACVVGIPAGILAAYRHNSAFDLATMFGALLGVSMPIFWLGLMLAYVFGFRLKLLPPSARLTIGVEMKTIGEAWGLTAGALAQSTARIMTPDEFFSGFYVLRAILTGNWTALRDVLSHLVLPSIALGSIPMAVIARMTRSSMLEVLGEDYIRTARAKGLQERVVLLRHALKNAFLPIITVIGLALGTLLGGAILTETIFSWPGLGRLVVDRILSRDYPVVQGSVLVIALMFVIINLLVDISYAYLDPRIRYE